MAAIEFPFTCNRSSFNSLTTGVDLLRSPCQVSVLSGQSPGEGAESITLCLSNGVFQTYTKVHYTLQHLPPTFTHTHPHSPTHLHSPPTCTHPPHHPPTHTYPHPSTLTHTHSPPTCTHPHPPTTNIHPHPLTTHPHSHKALLEGFHNEGSKVKF